jgi:hypothetical protein
MTNFVHDYYISPPLVSDLEGDMGIIDEVMELEDRDGR